MTVHLVKLCAGAASVDDLRGWVEQRVLLNISADIGAVHDCVTRMRPKRVEELLDGGSLYWVIKGAIQVRQEILGLEPRRGGDDIERTAILLKPTLVLTTASPRRAFQGWRYLSENDAPCDLADGGVEDGVVEDAPPELAAELAALGLL